MATVLIADDTAAVLPRTTEAIGEGHARKIAKAVWNAATDHANPPTINGLVHAMAEAARLVVEDSTGDTEGRLTREELDMATDALDRLFTGTSADAREPMALTDVERQQRDHGPAPEESATGGRLAVESDVPPVSPADETVPADLTGDPADADKHRRGFTEAGRTSDDEPGTHTHRTDTEHVGDPQRVAGMHSHTTEAERVDHGDDVKPGDLIGDADRADQPADGAAVQPEATKATARAKKTTAAKTPKP